MACCFRTCCGWKKHPQRHGQTFAKIEHQQRHNVVFVEFKSYQEDTELSSKGVNQFLGYLSDSRVNSLNDIVYVFNRKKINDTQAKQKMQNVLRNNAPKILSPIVQGGIGLTKVRQLFGNSITTVQDFIDIIDVISGNPIYNFVITN